MTCQLHALRSDKWRPAWSAAKAPWPSSEPWVKSDAYRPTARSSEHRGGRLRGWAGRPALKSRSSLLKVVLPLLPLLHRPFPGHPRSAWAAVSLGATSCQLGKGTTSQGPSKQQGQPFLHLSCAKGSAHHVQSYVVACDSMLGDTARRPDCQICLGNSTFDSQAFSRPRRKQSCSEQAPKPDMPLLSQLTADLHRISRGRRASSSTALGVDRL